MEAFRFSLRTHHFVLAQESQKVSQRHEFNDQQQLFHHHSKQSQNPLVSELVHQTSFPCELTPLHFCGHFVQCL